jgi:hypothetical protein
MHPLHQLQHPHHYSIAAPAQPVLSNAITLNNGLLT